MPKQTQTTTTQSTARTNTPVRPAPTRNTGAEALVQRAMADPATLSAQDVVKLQRSIGNSATKDLLARTPALAGAPAVQRAPIVDAADGGAWHKSYHMGPSLTKGGAAIQRAPWVRATPSQLGPEGQQSPSGDVTTTTDEPVSERQSPPRTWVSATPTALRPQGQESSEQEAPPRPSLESPTTVTDQGPESVSDEQSPTDDQTTTDEQSTTDPTTTEPTTRPRSTTVLGPPLRPSTAAPVVPIYPAILTEAQWRTTLSVMAKLGRDEVGTQLKIVNAAHRGVVWNRFDITKLPPAHSIAAEQSIDAATASNAAVDTAKLAQAAAKTATDEADKLATARAASAAVSKAKELLDATRAKSKTAMEEAVQSLGQAKAEFERSVILVLGRLQMLSDVLMKKQSSSNAVAVGNMLAAANAYRNKLMALTNTYKVFEEAIDLAKARGDEAERMLSELEASETDEFGLPLNPGVTDWDPDTDEDGNPMPKPVKAYLGGKFYGDLKKMKFPLNRDVVAWFTAEDATVSAKTGQPNQPNLARLQDQGQEAAEDFVDISEDLVTLGNDVLERDEALDKVNNLWKKAHEAFGDETKGGVFGTHKQWTRQQINLVGGQSQFDAWKLKAPLIVAKHTKAGTVLKADMTTVKALEAEVTQASH